MVIMRNREPKATALVFTSGKMLITGAKAEEDARLSARKLVRVLQKLGFEAKFTEFTIVNMVANCDVGYRISLESLSIRHHTFSEYEPELFPGLIYRMMRPKVTLLIFASGKVVITGAKVRQDIKTSFELVYPVLMEFRKAEEKPSARS